MRRQKRDGERNTRGGEREMKSGKERVEIEGRQEKCGCEGGWDQGKQDNGKLAAMS